MKQDISPYAQWMIDNTGYMFVDRKDGKPVQKWLMYNTFGGDPKVMATIYEGTHSRYMRMVKVDEIKENKFDF